jgi:hypothetical protein
MEPGQAKDILDKLLHDLYEVPILVVYDNIAKIVYDNIELTLNLVNDEAVRYVRFENEIYFSANLSNYKDRQSVIYDTHIPNRSMVLHNNTKESLIPQIAELKELDIEQKECAHYLRILLNQCNTLSDINALLPDAAWNILDIKLPTHAHDLHNEFTLSNKEIQGINEKYHEEAATIKERIFLNLLLKKV